MTAGDKIKDNVELMTEFLPHHLQGPEKWNIITKLVNPEEIEICTRPKPPVGFAKQRSVEIHLVFTGLLKLWERKQSIITFCCGEACSLIGAPKTARHV